MKSIARILMLVAVLAGGALLSGFTSGDNNAAGIDKDFGCTVFDGNGNAYFSNDGISVVNNGGNTLLVCKAKDAPNDTGMAVRFVGFGCNTYGGFTLESSNLVSADGNVTLRCEIKK